MSRYILPRTDEVDVEKQHGALITVSGPVVIAENLEGAALYEVVKVGHKELLGEIIKIEKTNVIIQVFEDTGGLKVGDPVLRTGKPLCVELGPGLLGQVYDGIQRSLSGYAESAAGQNDIYIPKGLNIPALNRDTKWFFEPNVKKFKEGDLITGGDVFGTVVENALIVHLIMLPPDEGGRIVHLAEADHYTVKDVVLEIEFEGQIKKFTMMQTWPVRKPRPVTDKKSCDAPLVTGLRVLDTLFPCAMGGTAALPGYKGCGKTGVIYSISKYSNADIVMKVSCGERANELAETLMDYPHVTVNTVGGQQVPIMNKIVMIANTSNMPLAAREAAIFSGVTICEYYRDMGYNVCMLADSTTRWAEALREISSRLGEPSGAEGYPVYLGSRLAAFYERAGKAQCIGSDDRNGSVTIVTTVSPPAGDFSEPVCEATVGLVQAFWALDHKLAQRRHFPCVNWLHSFSRCTKALEPFFESVDPEFSELRRKSMAICEREAELNDLVLSIGKDALPEKDKATLACATLLREDFMCQNGFTMYDRYCPLWKGAWMLHNMLLFHDRAQQTLAEHPEDVKWTHIREKAGDLLYRITCMKFEDPADGEEAVVAKYKVLRKEIQDWFNELDESNGKEKY